MISIVDLRSIDAVVQKGIYEATGDAIERDESTRLIGSPEAQTSIALEDLARLIPNMVSVRCCRQTNLVVKYLATPRRGPILSRTRSLNRRLGGKDLERYSLWISKAKMDTGQQSHPIDMYRVRPSLAQDVRNGGAVSR